MAAIVRVFDDGRLQNHGSIKWAKTRYLTGTEREKVKHTLKNVKTLNYRSRQIMSRDKIVRDICKAYHRDVLRKARSENVSANDRVKHDIFDVIKRHEENYSVTTNEFEYIHEVGTPLPTHVYSRELVEVALIAASADNRLPVMHFNVTGSVRKIKVDN